jgi:hypothetical protein
MQNDYVGLVFAGKIDDILKKRKRTRRFITDKNGITCDDMRFLLVLGAKPKTKRGRDLELNHEQEHQRGGTLCFDANDALDMHADSKDPENRRRIEKIFGPCEWPKR